MSLEIPSLLFPLVIELFVSCSTMLTCVSHNLLSGICPATFRKHRWTSRYNRIQIQRTCQGTPMRNWKGGSNTNPMDNHRNIWWESNDNLYTIVWNSTQHQWPPIEVLWIIEWKREVKCTSSEHKKSIMWISEESQRQADEVHAEQTTVLKVWL